MVDGDSVNLLKCSCYASIQQRARLDAYPRVFTTNAEAIVLHEKSEYCVHSYAVDILVNEDDPQSNEGNVDEQDGLVVDFLSLDPLLVAVFDGETYGLVGHKRTSKLQCLMCSHRCHHVKLLSDWCRENDIHLDREDPLVEQTFKSVSYTSIPYPLPVHLRQLHDKHERGALEFPVNLTPPHSTSLKCEQSIQVIQYRVDGYQKRESSSTKQPLQL